MEELLLKEVFRILDKCLNGEKEYVVRSVYEQMIMISTYTGTNLKDGDRELDIYIRNKILSVSRFYGNDDLKVSLTDEQNSEIIYIIHKLVKLNKENLLEFLTQV